MKFPGKRNYGGRNTLGSWDGNPTEWGQWWLSFQSCLMCNLEAETKKLGSVTENHLSVPEGQTLCALYDSSCFLCDFKQCLVIKGYKNKKLQK